jgi:hypothetical protein
MASARATHTVPTTARARGKRREFM